MTTAPTQPSPAPAARPAAIGSAKPARVGGLWPERFELIDAWRGLAALAVVIHHSFHVFIGGPAVMLFFVISGYCIAASADSCQRKGLGFGRFMQRRARRIYPPYLLSIVFWACTRLVKSWTGGGNDLARPPWHWLQNLTLTQWVTLLHHPLPLAGSNRVLFVAAYWSLCYEEQFYILVGLMILLSGAFKVSIRSMVVPLIALGLAWNAVFPEISYGIFIEYWSLFGFGALVFYRLCRMTSPLHRRLVDLFLLAVLAGSVYLRWFSGIHWQADATDLDRVGREELRMVYQELAIAAGFALLLIVQRPLNSRITSSRLFTPLAALGNITFSLYLIHQFNLAFSRGVAERILAALGLFDRSLPPVTPREQLWYSMVLQLAVHITLASVFWYLCERPFLNKSLISKDGATRVKPGSPENSSAP